MNPIEITNAYGALVEKEIRQWFEKLQPSVPAYPMSEYHLGWRNPNLEISKTSQGKMLRPVLCLLSYQIFNPDIEKILPLASAIELYHNHSLVLDDIQDGDRFRRDRPSVWSLWGIGQGINVGLILGYLSHLFILKLLDRGFSQQQVLMLLDEMTNTALEVAEGQSLDLDFETKSNVAPQAYLEMIGKKTGSLISFSTYSGAYLGSGNESIAKQFKEFGRRLGVAMQIRDDLVGIWGDKALSGKEAAKDLRRRKKTFPVFTAFSLLKGDDSALLQNYFISKDEPEEKTIKKILELFEQKGVREHCTNEANHFMQNIFATLQKTGIDLKKLEGLEAFSRHAFDSIGTLRPTAAKV